MPSKLINNTLSSVASGVTQQYQEGRFDSQVEEMVNCMPSITRGVLRRNPINAVESLTGLTGVLENSFVYSYDRGTGTEQYIVIIPGDGSQHVYNANDGTKLYTTTGQAYLEVPSGYRAKDSFSAITIGDHTFITNSTKTVGYTSDVATSDGYEDMAFYWIKKTVSVTLNQYQTGTGTSGAAVQTGSLLGGYTYNLNGLNIRGTEDTRPTYDEIDLNTSDKIAEHFAVGTHPVYDPTGVYCPLAICYVPADYLPEDINDPETWVNATENNSVTSLAPKYEGSVCYNDAFTGTDWAWSDTFGNEASIGVWTVVKDSGELPTILPEDLDGFIVKISGGTSGEFDDYYLKYNYEARSWTETVSPGKPLILDPTTMPHVLYGLSDGAGGRTFEFNTYREIEADGESLVTPAVSKWGERESGGDNEVDDPSFIGSNITNIFFHKNRLGLLTNDTIVLSRTGDYGAFFVKTVQSVLDDDPIDLAVASTDVTILRHAVPTAGQLILFADDTQFSLRSLEGPLTPTSADIAPLSNYTYGGKADAQSIGNRVYFTNQAGGYSQLYSYRITDQGSQLTEANPMTIHLPTYIDKSVSKIVGHDVLGYSFIEVEDTPKELIVLTSVIKGNEDLQNAFHKWTFTENIVSTHIISNSLYILFDTGDLVSMSLEIPGSINDVVYSDTYNNIDGAQSYSSYLIFSEFFLRDAKGKGTVRGRYQLRSLQYTIEEDSKYMTNISSSNQSILDTDTMTGPTWVDTETWRDDTIWVDVDPMYTREYVDDDKVTVMSDSKKVEITFNSSVAEPTKGFELSTVNIEAFFHQRSTRA